VMARSKPWVFGGSLAFKSHRSHRCPSLVSAVCCQVEASASDRSFVQSSPTKCGVLSECDREASIMRRPCPTRGCCAMGWGETTLKSDLQKIGNSEVIVKRSLSMS
jgi:hypothetical protein